MAVQRVRNIGGQIPVDIDLDEATQAMAIHRWKNQVVALFEMGSKEQKV
jgi:hypothetical protein